MTSLTFRLVNGENLKFVATFSGIFSSLIGSGAEGFNRLAMSSTDEMKNELIMLPEAFDMDGDEQGHAVEIRRFLPKPVHSDIVLKNLRLFVARDNRNERLAMRTACVQLFRACLYDIQLKSVRIFRKRLYNVFRFLICFNKSDVIHGFGFCLNCFRFKGAREYPTHQLGGFQTHGGHH